MKTEIAIYGTAAIVLCNNSILDQQSVIYCGEDNAWIGRTCEYTECSNLLSITNGKVKFINRVPNRIASYKCNEGYREVGQSFSICLQNGSWSYTNFYCHEVPNIASNFIAICLTIVTSICLLIIFIGVSHKFKKLKSKHAASLMEEHYYFKYGLSPAPNTEPIDTTRNSAIYEEIAENIIEMPDSIPENNKNVLDKEEMSNKTENIYMEPTDEYNKQTHTTCRT
ncbi:uncharacterized protein LOC111626721 [Centruroides sculpturatus]|uniref:uncharacterized protein LOC111626721 n=1 Tax=Centruroides sculpturatus TaxID=218467 RepID=UPI000C6E5B03|nr:uncharacterized protein LOC111626721 [Centruroides sculpturatus]